MKYRNIMLILISSWTCTTAGHAGQPIDVASDEPAADLPASVRTAEKRVIIGLHADNATDQRMAEDPISTLAAMPLQHLGMIVRPWPISKGPPPKSWLQEARGVVTWFDSSANGTLDAAWVRPWVLQEILPRGIKLVVLGDLGPLALDATGNENPSVWAAVLRQLGLEPSEKWVTDPLIVDVQSIDPRLTALEEAVVSPVHMGPVAPSSPFTPWVRTSLPGEPTICAPVLTGPFGGIALTPYVMWTGSGYGDRRWHLDLFEFLREALALKGVPVPDPCVVSGRRAFFLQVDGDGFESITSVRPGTMAAQVFLDEVIDRFDLPMTVSIIVAGVTDRLQIASSLVPMGPTGKPADRVELARSILSRPNVEVASHGVLHPLKWQEELKPSTPTRTVVWYDGLEGYGYSPEAEVTASADFIDALLEGTGRTCEVMLWTGNALPSESVLKTTRERGLANVNGGTFRFDEGSGSVGYVSPLVRIEGEELQVYCGAGNENIYEGFFNTHPGAFRLVAKSIRRSGFPRILKPANIYIHFYAAEQFERLRSIQDLIQEFGIDGDVTPITAGDYWQLATDAFTTARVTRVAERTWDVEGMGAGRTLRLDGGATFVDFDSCDGVVGARRIAGSLYVTLSQPKARVVLSETEPAPRPHLVHTSFALDNASLAADGLTFRAQTYAKREVTVAGFAADSEIVIQVRGTSHVLKTNGHGEAMFSLPPGDDQVTVIQR